MFLLKIVYGALLVTLIYANCKIVGTLHEAHIAKVYFRTAGISFAILNSSTCKRRQLVHCRLIVTVIKFGDTQKGL